MHMKIDLTPELFLAMQGIELESTVLNTFVDGCVRQPNLCNLMEEYAKMKISELDYKITTENKDKKENSMIYFYERKKTNFTM
jgi:hypothetical protein